MRNVSQLLILALFICCTNQKGGVEQKDYCKFSEYAWYGPVGFPKSKDFIEVKPNYRYSLASGAERIDVNGVFVMYENLIINEYKGFKPGTRNFLMYEFLNSSDITKTSYANFFIPLKDSCYFYFETLSTLKLDSAETYSFYECFTENIKIEEGERLDSLIEKLRLRKR